MILKKLSKKALELKEKAIKTIVIGNNENTKLYLVVPDYERNIITYYKIFDRNRKTLVKTRSSDVLRDMLFLGGEILENEN